MFSRIAILVVLLVFSSQITCDSDASYIDKVVNDCQINVSMFAATEGKYAKADRKPAEPVLFGELIPYLIQIAEVGEQNQRVFECIADKLDNYTDSSLKKSYRYRNLTQKCESERPIDPQCNSSYPYRTMNATCNNIDNPKWGSTLDCLTRRFPANYEGAAGLRKSVSGKSLPLPRNLSLNIVKPKLKLSTGYNALFSFFGQALAHDITQLIFTTDNGTTVLDCCAYAKTREQHPQCIPILLQPNDPFYSRLNLSCLTMERMVPCDTCSLNKRIQMNQVTSYIDCSLTYGQYDERAMNLRRNDGSGKLLSQYTKAGELMPGVSEVGTERCGRGPPEEKQYCMRSGDTRTNQHAVLAMIQTLLLREHNRIADKLKILNSHWDEERLYQESRKILIAEFQVMAYSEYLPILLGKKLMSQHELYIGSGGGYNPTVDASISIEFNAAAFRIHSLIPGKVVPDEEYEYLRSLFINVAPLYNGRTSSYFRKMANYPAEEYDEYMPIDLTDYLYRENHGKYGYDLAAVDIQRGRDVGLPTYTQVIEYLEKRSRNITKFKDLEEYLVPECQELLEENYDNVRDIDLWVGLNCERLNGMIISPTAAELIAEQFKRLKFGDRFYFEHDDTFTYEQRQTLLDASLARLICDNTDVLAIQPEAMLFPNFKNNNPVLCFLIPGVDLTKWKEFPKAFETHDTDLKF